MYLFPYFLISLVFLFVRYVLIPLLSRIIYLCCFIASLISFFLYVCMYVCI